MSDVTAKPGATALLPFVAIAFISFLCVGAPLPALSLYVHGRLGYGTVIVGLVIAAQSITTILTRHWAGMRADLYGPRRAVLAGLPVAALAGLLYAAAALLPVPPAASLLILLLGRVVLGIGESLFIVGIMSWAIVRLGPARTGLVMSWQGIALYAALGLGAPLGLWVQSAFGFVGIGLLTIAAPLLALPIAWREPAVPATGGGRVPLHRVVGLIWRPGLVLTLATVPYAAMATFLPLDYASQNWSGAGLALLGFGAGYIAIRLLGSHWPDRHGAARVAMVSMLVEIVGQLLVWRAASPIAALVGALLTGIGFSLIFPAMGVEATRRVPPEARGRAVGNFIAFFDLALAITGPAVGLLAGTQGYPSAFLAGAVASLLALVTLLTAMRAVPKPS